MKQKLPLVRIDFDDHAQTTGGEANHVTCTVFGILYRESKKAYYVTSWISDGEFNGINSDTYCVLKGTVIKFQKIRDIDFNAKIKV